MKRVENKQIIEDTLLSGGKDSCQIIQATIDQVLTSLSESSIDWSTLDLRIFRDVNGDPLRRDEFLTVRATGLTE